MKKPPQPDHVSGTPKGEETALDKKEPGRNDGKDYRSARDSTSINPDLRKPILSVMPNIPPA